MYPSLGNFDHGRSLGGGNTHGRGARSGNFPRDLFRSRGGHNEHPTSSAWPSPSTRRSLASTSSTSSFRPCTPLLLRQYCSACVFLTGLFVGPGKDRKTVTTSHGTTRRRTFIDADKQVGASLSLQHISYTGYKEAGLYTLKKVVASSSTSTSTVSSTSSKPSSTQATSTTSTTSTAPATSSSTSSSGGFVTTSGTKFMLDGKHYCFAGMNAYWIPQLVTESQYDATFASLANAGIRVVRTWAFSMVTSVPNYDLTYFQDVAFIDNSSVNTGSNGLGRLDLAVQYAAKYGIKIIMTLTNNWDDLGGCAFDSYINTIVNRYKSNPAIFAWEIANEPRNGGTTAAKSDFTVAQLTQWISDRASYIKSLDSNHMVAIGDWAYNGNSGLDFNTNLKLSNIDFGTFHMYPEAWGETPVEGWGSSYIQAHIDSIAAVNGGVSWMPWQFGPDDLDTTAGQDSMDLYPSKASIWSAVTSGAASMNSQCPL
ncbi:uncharacterized protein EHS24_005367 [Apiotrichum porosum]|uniref:mannan endo-1,4-beta-mannosidase n=1 Tax=Apiotrichum porosum TaxID=105984 RepID=A0A427XD23_9TREE|nr:uncharacterized protein EHS24_005367 [Apiotrichum porosum]RSH76789.1 hypothetical protein EHS24_005367 [Apiotrichum porosum]